ncbi:MAG: hypothetical protein ACRC54_04670 [Fusobacteriaceae bacterium]
MKKEILEKLSALTIFDKEETPFPEVITFEEIQNSKFKYNKEFGIAVGEFELEDLLSEILQTKEGELVMKKALSNIILKKTLK